MPRLRLGAAVLAGAALAAAPRPARADERGDEERPELSGPASKARGVKLDLRLGTRSLQTAPFSKDYRNLLTA